MSAGAYTRTPGSAKEPAHPAEQPSPPRLDRTPAAAERTSQPVAHGGPDPAVSITLALRLGAGEEGLAPRLRAASCREQSGRRIDVPPDDVVERHILTEAEFRRVADRVTVGRGKP